MGADIVIPMIPSRPLELLSDRGHAIEEGNHPSRLLPHSPLPLSSREARAASPHSQVPFSSREGGATSPLSSMSGSIQNPYSSRYGYLHKHLSTLNERLGDGNTAERTPVVLAQEPVTSMDAPPPQFGSPFDGIASDARLGSMSRSTSPEAVTLGRRMNVPNSFLS